MSDTPTILDTLQAGDAGALREHLERDPAAAAFRDRNGISVLMHCLYRGREDLAALVEEALQEQGVALDIFEAAARGRTERLTDLLHEDPSLTAAVSADGFGVLHLAASHGDAEMVRVLLEKGASPRLATDDGLSARHFAAEGGHQEVLELLEAALQT